MPRSVSKTISALSTSTGSGAAGAAAGAGWACGAADLGGGLGLRSGGRGGGGLAENGVLDLAEDAHGGSSRIGAELRGRGLNARTRNNMHGRGIEGRVGRVGGFVGGRFVRGIDGEAEMKVALAGLDGRARGKFGLVVGVVDGLFGLAQRA